MLGAVNEIPATPAEVIVGKRAEGNELHKWTHLTGDIIIFHRLAQWAQYGALHAEPHTTPNGMVTALYTITDLGKSFLRDGLTSIDQAPPLPIWGVTAYDPNHPWVVVKDSAGGPWFRRLD
jgi:hypothetical protein